MKKIGGVLSQFFPSKIGPFGYFMMFLQFFYLYQLFVTDDTGGMSFSWVTLGYIGLSMVTVVLVYLVVSALSSRSRGLFVVTSSLFLVGYALIAAYQFGAKEALNFSIIAENVSNFASVEAMEFVVTSLDMGALQYLMLFLGVFLVLEFTRKTISKGRQESPYYRRCLGPLLIYGLIVISPLDSLDPFLSFVRTAQHHYMGDSYEMVVIEPGKTPLLRDGKVLLSGKFKERKTYPDIFLIIAESLNESALSLTAPSGEKVTPFLNQLKTNAVTVDHFYGNSIQTPKGQFATLFSVIPSISGKTFQKYPETRVDSIATVLGRVGYETTFFSAYHNKDFDNTHDYVTSKGFDQFRIIDPHLTDQDKQNSLRWGVEDGVFLERFLEVFIEEKRENSKPQFVVLSTIANHFPFNSIPNDRCEIYKEVNKIDIKKNYANSIRLTDKGIKTFLELIKEKGLAKSSLIIITSDHSFPMGEHGNFHLEAGYHEESFRVPFYMVWDGVLSPQRIPGPYSQMDIAPTIVDVLGLSLKTTNFQGESIFQGTKNTMIYLIQPYGKHLSMVSYPYKYRYFTKTQREYIYDLENDPLETTSILKQVPPELVEKFRTNLQFIYLNQKGLVEDRFYFR